MLLKSTGLSSSVGIQPELEILLICANTQVDTKSRERLKILLQENIDWAELIQMANQHKVMPLLYSNLNAICPESVPKPILTKLKIEFQFNTRKSLLLSGELVRILNLFEKQGIPLLPFKGPVLAVSAADLLKADNHQKTLDQIFDYLEIESNPIKTNLKKVSSNHLSNDIKNYQELVDFINTTDYSHFLEN
ncbi:hypothetical protein PL8927_620037 [Planktothrix serta PCC 8927]|uniref:Uncharacterized protein n=1 Tax=Planktothrix serta PCC 8927 TaxID=671068 RepID=A0A7Z9BNY3_9CYAN|nr:nucleotidyltransferase family protein [Planktothrix serta]VXD19174.1 hypothetical protein PL8927_620037 [Planktothrix serta PCC 8927]